MGRYVKGMSMANKTDVGITYTHPIWLLSLVFPFRFGGALTGILIFALLFALFPAAEAQGGLSKYTILFFCAMIAYVIPVYAYIVRRSVELYDELAKHLQASEQQVAQWRRSFTHQSAGRLLITTILSLAAGCGHVLIIESVRDITLERLLAGEVSIVLSLATVLTWLVMTTAIGALVANAALLYQLGRDRVRIDLLQSQDLAPFARIAVISTLSMIGAQAVMGLLLLDPYSSPQALLPGLIATGVTMLPLFLLPVWSVHSRLRTGKIDELERIREQMDRLRGEATVPFQDAARMDDLNRLLMYRREIRQVSEWPFDVGVLTRLGLYLIIPPLTWVGAALIENLVDAVL